MKDLSEHLYSERHYWDARFKTEEIYEWLTDLNSFEHLLLPEIELNDKILHIGCGTSRLSHQLFGNGFHDIINVDFSNTLIAKASKEHPEMKWVCDDMRSLDNIPSQSIDVVIEKASIEAMLSNEKSQWTLSEKGENDLCSTYQAIHRVLKPNGRFISISFTQPYFKVPYLVKEPYRWDCKVETFGESFHYFCYKMRKGRTPNLIDLDNYLRVTR
uniref:Methyltransferase type 11 domain-containing protein n=1 Tax=Acrobeloides nanus TaxID=290746 RepID=A0A914EL97_9BILA